MTSDAFAIRLSLSPVIQRVFAPCSDAVWILSTAVPDLPVLEIPIYRDLELYIFLSI